MPPSIIPSDTDDELGDYDPAYVSETSRNMFFSALSNRSVHVERRIRADRGDFVHQGERPAEPLAPARLPKKLGSTATGASAARRKNDRVTDQFNVRIDQAIKTKIQQHARQTGEALGIVVEDALSQYLANSRNA